METNPGALQQPNPPAPKPSALSSYLFAILAVALPIAAFALAWFIAGKIPFAVPAREWGTWLVMGSIMGVAGIAGLVFTIIAFIRKRLRACAIAGLVLNPVVLLTAWAGLFG